MTISEATVGIVIDRAADWGHGALTTLLLRSGISKGDPGESSGLSRQKRANAALLFAFSKGNEKGIVECARRMLNVARRPEPDDPWVVELTAALRDDGYLVERREDNVPEETPAAYWGAPHTPTYIWTIEPIGSDELPLPPQVTSVERELIDSGNQVAATHLGQAFRAFKSGDLEASNGQVRSALEGVLISVAESETSWRGTAGGQAVQAINTAGLFEQGEHDYTIGLWRMSHKNGPHPGLSNDDEALFRLTSVTALIRFLLYRFP